MGKYSGAIEDILNEDAGTKARSSTLIAPAVSPDEMGKAMAVADRDGKPPAVVATNLREIDELDHLDTVQAAGNQTPALGRWLGDPNQAALARDDIGPLSDVSKLVAGGLLSTARVIPGAMLPVEALTQYGERANQQAAAAKGPQMQATPQAPWFSELIGDLQSGWYGGKQANAVTLPDFSSARTRSIEDVVGQSLGYAGRDEAQAARTAQAVSGFGREAQAASRTTKATEQAFRRLREAEASGSTGNVVTAALNPRVVMSTVMQSLGATAPNLAISASMPASRLMQAGATGTGSFTAEQGFTILDVMADAGVDTTDAGQVQKFLNNKPAMAAARRKATERGIAIGLFDAATAGFAGRLLRNSRKTFLSPVVRTAGEGLVQAGGGAAGEATAQLASEGRIESVGDIVLEAAAETPTFLAEGRGQIAEARRFGELNADRFDAASEQSSITKLVDLSSRSKTRERSATRFESLIRSMTDQGDDTVYLSADGARKLFQSGAEGEPSPLAGLIDPSALSEALATGGEIAIPLGQYAAYMTPEAHATVADQVRLQPGTRHDLPTVSAEEIQQAITDGLAAAQQEEERDNGPAGQVFDDIYGQLLTRQGEKLARQNATIVQSVYRNLAERVGTDAYTLFQQFRINLPGAIRDVRGAPRGVDVDVDPLLDALRSGKLPTDEEIVGEGLTTALTRAGGLRPDDGGELAALEAGNRPGLISGAGMSLDDALVWAHENGFIEESPTQFRESFEADAPDIQTLLDLLGQDLAGSRVGRPSQRNVQREQFREDARRLQEELDQRGIDLEQADNATARRALGMEPKFYQDAIPDADELTQLRAKVASLEKELRTDELTGLRNRRAFNEDEALGWEGVMAFDMDSLTALNKLGHDVGDMALKAIGDVMLGSETDTARFYHTSGDEFYGRARTMAEARALAQMIQDKLESVDLNIDVADADGNIRELTHKGIGVSRGAGSTPNEADQQAIRNKDEREAAGVRQAKGDPGPLRRLVDRRSAARGPDRRAGGDSEPAAGEAPQDGSVDRTLNQSPVDTEAFRAWFGDSKVVDANGEPLVVHHGTVSKFDSFEAGRDNGFTQKRMGFYFTDDLDVADEFGGRIIDAYLSLQNPLDMRYARRDDVWEAMFNAVESTGMQEQWERAGGNPQRFVEMGFAQGDEFVSAIEAQGYDSFVMRDSWGNQHFDSWVALRPNQIKSATANRGTFDPSDPSILNQSERGSVTFRTTPEGRQFDIQLLAGMDASTFVHELGHVYLELLTDLSQRDGAPQQIADDVATINEWLGRKGTTTTTEQHEKFARGFEAYLREGKAPTSALRRVFAAFKVWMTAIYRNALALNVELTDDVRGVFDRIIASDAEIEEARSEQYQEALITDAVEVGMSPEDFAAYNAAVLAARADAEAVVAAELLRAMQIEQKAWYREERKRVQAEVTTQLRESPAYRAQRLLRTGKLPDGTEAPKELQIKLDKNDLLDHYGQSFLRNLIGTYAVEGGVPSEEAADILGFRSGTELVDMMVNAPPLSEAIAAETDARMADRHPDPMTDGTLPDRAMVAAHRDRQADVMVREIRALEGVTGRPVTQGAVVKGIAASIIANKKLRHLQSATYKAAEARAGKEAFEAAAKQDWPAAVAARRRQLLNFELFREAVRARNEATLAARNLAKYGETKTRARLGKAGGEYLAQIDALLDRFDFRNITNKAADRRSSLAAWIKLQSERGQELDLPDAVLDEAFRVPYRDLTMGQLREIRDAVKAIDHLAKLKGKLLLGAETRDAAEIDAAMATSVLESSPKAKVTTGDELNRTKILRAFRQGRVIQATATDLARELDGFKPGAAVWRNTVGVIRDAINLRVNPELNKAQEALANVYLKHYTKEQIRDFGRLVPMPEVNGDLWSKRRLLALALNWGNEGNREAILSQAKARLTKGQVDALLGRLDARDWAFVEEVWGLVDSYWPAISEAQKRRTGLSPEKVKASPFIVRTADGQTLSIPGGYYPLKYESDSIRTMKDEADDFWNSIRAGRSAKAATKNGHTIERVGSGGRTVALDTTLIQSHLRDVIRDLYLGDAVNYVHDVLNGSGFRQAIDATGQQEYAKALEVWLKDVAAGEIGPRVWHERAMRAVRTNFTASVLAFKPVSAALQITGLIQSSVVLGQADTWQGVAQYATKPIAMTRYVHEASPFMAARSQTHIEAVQQVMTAEQGKWSAGKASMIRFGYWLMGRVQQQVDIATWLAAENQGMRLFDNDVDKARQYADDAVARAQSSGEFIDKNPIQRGTLGDNVRQSEWIKAASVLQSYMYSKGNAAYEITRKTNFKSPLQTTRWAMNMAMLFTVEAIVVAAIRGQLPDDDDDDGSSDEWAAFLTKQTLSNLFGAVPGGGVAVSEMRGYDAKGVMATAWESVSKFWSQAEQGEMDRAVTKAAVTVAGVTMGVPSAQINKTIDAVTASADGEDVSPWDYLTGPEKKK